MAIADDLNPEGKSRGKKNICGWRENHNNVGSGEEGVRVTPFTTRKRKDPSLASTPNFQISTKSY